jgi:hypothetical protein
MGAACSAHGRDEKGRDHSEDLDIDGKIILESILGKCGEKVWTGFIWLRMGPVTGSFERSNEASGYIKGGEFLVYLSDYQLLKKDSAPWSSLRS